MLEESVAFEMVERLGLIVYLYYNRDLKKLEKFGNVVYHSRKHRYAQIYIDQKDKDQVISALEKERFVREVKPSAIKDLDQQFVGSLWRDTEVKISED